jgi:hypothetical protein
VLKRATDYVIALLDLLEAEAVSLRGGLMRTGTALTLVLAGIGLFTAAAAVFGWALYLALLPYWGRAGAAAACGVLLALFGGGFLWAARPRGRS